MQKNSFSKIVMIMVIAVISHHNVQAQTKNEFSVKQAVDYGMKNSAQVKNALLDILIQQQENRDITSAAYPEISANGSVNDYLDIPTTLVPGEFIGQPAGTFIPVKFGTKWITTAGLALQQVIFDGQVFVGLQARKTVIDAKTKAAEVTQENIKANIYKVYYQLVVGKTQISLLDANIARLDKLSHDTKEMYKNGFSEQLDVDKLTVQIANLQTEKLKAENSIKNGYSGLKFLIGMPIKDTLILTDTVNDDQLRENVLENAQYNYTDRKDYQALLLTKKLDQFDIKRYKLSQIPTLKLTGNYSKQAQRDQFDFFDKGDWFTTSYIGLQMSIPIFKGFSTRAKIQKAKLQLQQTENQVEGLKLSIDNDVDTAKNGFATAIASMDYQKKNMELAEMVYNQTKKKYEVGTGSATDINAAETDLKTAQTNYISSLYDAIIAKIDFLKAVGKL